MPSWEELDALSANKQAELGLVGSPELERKRALTAIGSRTKPKNIHVLRRRALALSLRKMHVRYEDIADRVQSHFADDPEMRSVYGPEEAADDVRDAIKEIALHYLESAEEVRALESMRLDRQSQALWPLALGAPAQYARNANGDIALDGKGRPVVLRAEQVPSVDAHRELVRIQERRAKLYALDIAQDDAATVRNNIQVLVLKGVTMDQLP